MMTNKRRGLIFLLCLLFVVLCCSCGRNESASSSDLSAKETQEIPASAASTTVTAQPEATEPQMVQSDLKPSDGLDFKSNADGTCTLAGIGICRDSDLVIPGKSPDGEVVSRIEESAFWSLEDINSVTLLNMTCVVEGRAFQYGEFTWIALLGGDLTIEGSAFSSCEDVTEITVESCTLKAEEYAFFSCGKDAAVTFTGVSGELGKRAFQYAELAALTFNGCVPVIRTPASMKPTPRGHSTRATSPRTRTRAELRSWPLHKINAQRFGMSVTSFYMEFFGTLSSFSGRVWYCNSTQERYSNNNCFFYIL